MTEAAPPRASLGHIRPRPPNTSQSGRATSSEFCQSSRVACCSSSSRNPPASSRRHPPTVPSVVCSVALFIFRVRQTLLRFPSHSRPASSCMSGWTGAGSDHSHPPTSAASKRSAPVVGDRVGVETRAHPELAENLQRLHAAQVRHPQKPPRPAQRQGSCCSLVVDGLASSCSLARPRRLAWILDHQSSLDGRPPGITQQSPRPCLTYGEVTLHISSRLLTPSRDLLSNLLRPGLARHRA
jgi:hypothetical protein